jgi:hypothetical protein
LISAIRPWRFTSVDFHGKTVIQRTSAGTQRIVLASSRAEPSLRGFALPADATAFRISPNLGTLWLAAIEIALRRLAMA